MDQIRMNRLDSQFDKAVDCLREAIAIYEEIGKKNSYLYASAQNNLALVYLDTNDTEHAEACLQDAHAIVHDLAAQSPVFIPELAASYCNLASVRYQNQEYDKALSYCEKALNEYERVPEKDRSHLAAVWNLIGNIRMIRKDTSGAKEAYEQALSWTRRFFGENHEYRILQKKLSQLQ